MGRGCRAASPRRRYQTDPTFDPEFIMSKSTAAAGLCSWCLNIVRFYKVYCEVEPKRLALEEANAELAEAQDKLSRIKKNEDADKLIHVVGVETEKVSKEKAIADEEELKVQAINTVRGAGQHPLAAPTAPYPAPLSTPCPFPLPRTWLRSSEPARPTWPRLSPRSSPRRKPSTHSTRYGRAQLCGCGPPGAPCPAVLSAPCSLPRTT